MEISRFEYCYYRESRMQDYHLQRLCKNEGMNEEYLGYVVKNSYRRPVFSRMLKQLARKIFTGKKSVRPLQDTNDQASLGRLAG